MIIFSGVDPSRMNQAILVCTAHIHWDPEYSDVKLIQTMMLVHEIKTFVDDILQKSSVPPSQKLDPNVIPLILCGDFNSLPDSGKPFTNPGLTFVTKFLLLSKQL